MIDKNKKSEFDIIFEKMDTRNDSASTEFFSAKERIEADEINKLREIVLDVSEEEQRYFSRT